MATLIKRNWDEYTNAPIMCKQLDEKYEARVYHDEYASHPRKFCDSISRLYAWHRSYGEVISDSNEFSTPEAFMEWAEEDGGDVFELYMYDHSGITLSLSSFNDPWDSGQVGFAYISQSAKEELRLNREQTIEYLQNDIDELTQYINGYVYTISVHLIEDMSKTPIGDEPSFSMYTEIYNKNLRESIFDDHLKELLEELDIKFSVDDSEWMLIA